MNITTPSTLPPPVAQSLALKMLSVPTPNFIHRIPAMLQQMPAHGGDTLRMERDNPLASATVPLGNSGVSPPAQQLTSVFIDAKINFYGSYVYINEQTQLQNQNPVLNRAARRLGVMLRQTEDELTRDMLKSTASFINAVEGSNGDSPTEITREDVDTVIKTLADNNAYTISDNIEGDDKFGTAPVRDAYFAMGSTKLIGDLERVSGFIAKAQYPNQMSVLRPEWCSISNLRFLLSSQGSVSPNSSAVNGADVYNIFVTGLEAYSCVEQSGYSTKYIYRPPIYDGPLAQNASVAVKFADAQVITNDAWVLNFRVTLNT